MAQKRFVKFINEKGQPQWGERQGGFVKPLNHAPWKEGSQAVGPLVAMRDLKLLAPVEPTKILAMGYNYKDLFEDSQSRVKPEEPTYGELGFEPVVFLKAANCIAGPQDTITISRLVKDLWVEVELAVVIGKKIKNAKSRLEAQNAIFGCVLANDVSSTNVFSRDWHLARSKSLDGYCPFGSDLVAGLGFEEVDLQTTINSKVTQKSNTSNRVLDSADSVLFISSLMTLEPGDVILTGTPKGAKQSQVKAGDEVVLSIEGLGDLRNSYVTENLL
ncbi:MAG: fumarylacetoacetate hydrolase family protein [Oligoflexia bacterium]|nr:fumarylacetoacetate hydrolase family protein [Oligoflexia bacterium]